MIVQEPNNYCIMCGTIIPEGRQICPICEKDEPKKETVDAIPDDVLKQIKAPIQSFISKASSDGFSILEIHHALHKYIDTIIKEEEE